MSGNLRKDLGRTRGHANKHINKYNELILNHPAPWDNVMKAEFRTVMNRMKSALDKFDDYFNKWDLICTNIRNADDSIAERELFDQWKDEYDELIEETETIVEGIQEKLKLNIVPVPIVNQVLPLRETTIGNTATVPPINLPKFNGDYLKWSPFWQRFQHAVHSKPYPKIEKLISLLGFLEGKALEEVEGFTVSEENYDTIVETLVERFGKKSLIIIELQSKLRGIENSSSDAECLRSTVNMICNMCRQLQNLGVDVDNYSTKIDIIEKMPDNEKDKLKWLLISDPENSTIDKLMDKMKEMALKAEIASKPSNKCRSNENFTDSSLKSKPTDSGGKFKCSLCDELHNASTCPNFISPEAKLKQLNAKNFCTKCGYRNHDTKNCQRKLECKNCKSNHATFLCTSKPSTILVAVEKKQGMLMTKEVLVVNPVTKETTETVVLFDTGSQQSYISNQLIKQLNLQRIQEEEIYVTGFGAKTSNYTSSLIQLQLKTNDGYTDIFANSTKKIATAVPVVHAESFESNDIKIIYKPADILIGMDYFLKFISSFEKHGDDLYIVNSSVGKMLCKSIPKNCKTTVSSLAIKSSQHFHEAEHDLQKLSDRESYMELTEGATQDTVKIVTTGTDVIDDNFTPTSSNSSKKEIQNTTEKYKIGKDIGPKYSTNTHQQRCISNINFDQQKHEKRGVDVSKNCGSDVQKSFQRQHKHDRPPNSLTTDTAVINNSIRENLSQEYQKSHLYLSQQQYSDYIELRKTSTNAGSGEGLTDLSNKSARKRICCKRTVPSESDELQKGLKTNYLNDKNNIKFNVKQRINQAQEDCVDLASETDLDHLTLSLLPPGMS